MVRVEVHPAEAHAERDSPGQREGERRHRRSGDDAENRADASAHRGVANTGESLRLSIDARYQRLDAPIAPGSLLPHSQPNTWENVYLDWPDSSLQYYWRQYELHITDYDDSYHEERDRQAMELGAQGDPLSVSVLQRIIARDKDLQKRQRATELLAAIEDDETTAP